MSLILSSAPDVRAMAEGRPRAGMGFGGTCPTCRGLSEEYKRRHPQPQTTSREPGSRHVQGRCARRASRLSWWTQAREG